MAVRSAGLDERCTQNACRHWFAGRGFRQIRPRLEAYYQRSDVVAVFACRQRCQGQGGEGARERGVDTRTRCEVYTRARMGAEEYEAELHEETSSKGKCEGEKQRGGERADRVRCVLPSNFSHAFLASEMSTRQAAAALPCFFQAAETLPTASCVQEDGVAWRATQGTGKRRRERHANGVLGVEAGELVGGRA